MNYISCFYALMSTGVVVTHVWRSPVRNLRCVMSGIYISMVDSYDIRLVDAEVGGDYYGKTGDYFLAAQMERERSMLTAFGDQFYLSANMKKDVIVVEAFKGPICVKGCGPDWAARDGDRVHFELVYGDWILRGYVTM